jgi:hypothetical protein
VDRCGFCGSTEGPFTSIEGMFTVLMCPACLARRSRGRGPYPELSDAEMRAGLDLLPTWVLEQKAAAFSVPTCKGLGSLASCESAWSPTISAVGQRALRRAAGSR